jgi:hypothetical protein
MLASTKPLNVEQSDPTKREDAMAFRQVAEYFQTSALRLLRKTVVYEYDFRELIGTLEEVSPLPIVFVDSLLPYFTVQVGDYFVVHVTFSLDRRPTFVVVQAASEKDKGVWEQSAYRVYRTLGIYFSRVLPDFMMKYHARGIIEFVIWLQCYEGLFTRPCCKCEQLIERDLTGDMLPPLIRAVGSCYPYHIKCAPFEIELPDFGYVTLVSDDQAAGSPEGLPVFNR